MKESIIGFLDKLFSGSNSRSGFKFMAIPETLFFLAICILINYLLFPKDMGFLKMPLHPFWIIIILIPIRYGLVEGLISALLAGGCYHIFSINLASDYSLTYPLLFILTSGILGQNRDVLDRRFYRLEDRLQIISGRLEDYKKKEAAYLDTLGHFEHTIAAQFSDAMDMFKELAISKKMSPQEMKFYLLEIIKKFLGAAKLLSAQNGIVFKEKMMRGDIGYNIVKLAQSKSEKFNLIVIGSRGRGSMKETFFGSVSNYVIHTSKIPVLIVK